MIFEKIRERLEEEKQRLRKLKNDTITLFDSEVIAIEEQSYNFCKEIINQVEAEYSNGWIKCEGKTFAVGCKYLIVDKDNDIYIATYLNDNVFIARDKNYFMPIRLEATYCQLLPLPQPPKGE